MKAIRSILIALTLTLTATSFTAQAQEGQKIKEIVFGDDVIDGELAHAQFTDVTAIGEAELPTLIRVRDSFSDAMIKEVEDL